MRIFWSSVFGRIVRLRYHNETFRAAWPGVLKSLERRLSPPDKWINDLPSSEDSAYRFFESEFARLLPDEQRALSGHTFKEWLQLDKDDREDAQGANDRLIAAAPDLLNACKVALVHARERQAHREINMLEAAIAKAEGRS